MKQLVDVTVRTVMKYGLVSAMSVGTVLGSTALAHAEPNQNDQQYMLATCHDLRANPTIAGVTNVASALMENYSGKKAGDIIFFATTNYCPEYHQLVMKWADIVNPAGANPVSGDGMIHDQVL